MPRSRAKHAGVAPLSPAVDLDIFRQMADRSSEAFYLVDRRGRFLYVNAKAPGHMGGYTVDDLLALSVSDLCPDIPPEVFEADITALERGPLPLIEARSRGKDGRMFLVEVSTARLEFGGETYVFGVARDITERKAVEAVRKSLALQLLETIERERQRVARELHDDVGQALATIGVLLDAIEIGPPAIPESVRASLTSTRATIARIAESLARIVREYHPAELLGLGLEDTLRAHARHFAERHKIGLWLATETVEDLLTPEQELHFYRVVQEALANVARHSQAASVHVTLKREADHLVVEVRDDGVGFAPDTPTPGIGLATMRERATLLQAVLVVDSAPGRGTTVRLAMPIGEPAAAADVGAAYDVTQPLPIPVSPPPFDERTLGRPLPAPLDREVFRQMADMASESFMLADRDGRFVYVNDRACTLSGFSREELLAMTISDINPDYPPEEFEKWVLTTGGDAPPFDTRHYRKDGTIIPVEVSATRIDRPGGEPYFFGLVRDLRSRRETEAAQKGFTRRLLYTLEAERRRVARELHDEVGQAIAAVGILLHTLESTPGSIPATLDRELTATYATVRQITESVAGIVRDYHPADLLALGLEETIRTHALQFAQRHGLLLRLATIATDGLLTDERALHVYRIVQEALANVARHAGARHVIVRLVRRAHRLVVTVSDDGSGFDAARTRAGALGLVTMRERAALVEGTLEVRSRPGRGTEVRVSVPISGHRRESPSEAVAARRVQPSSRGGA